VLVKTITEAEVLLSELKIGQDATVAKVGGKGPMRLRLLDMGLIPGTVVKIQKKAPLEIPYRLIYAVTS
jgi:Fe2+ transport system protein FeoA